MLDPFLPNRDLLVALMTAWNQLKNEPRHPAVFAERYLRIFTRNKMPDDRVRNLAMEFDDIIWVLGKQAQPLHHPYQDHNNLLHDFDAAELDVNGPSTHKRGRKSY